MADGMTPLDRIDRRIIGELLQHGRAPVATIAETVQLSRSATSERIKRLEYAGWIAGYQAILHPAVTGRTLEAFIGLEVAPNANRHAVEDWISAQPAVTEAIHLTGQHDYLIRVHCHNTEELDELLMSMKNDAHITGTETSVALRHLDVTPNLTGLPD